ncbi:MAG: hypothetical protein AAF740_00140 [Bacteroidota bacterium]
MRNTYLRFLGIILAFCLASAVQGQVFPVSANLQLTPPNSVYLADYAAPGSQAFTAIVTFQDLNKPSVDVGLRIRIEGPNVVLETKQDFRPSMPITLLPGATAFLSGEDLIEYFNLQNLNISGLSQADLSTGARLPEGFYQFCFEVYEINSGVAISRQACQSAFLSLQDEPLTLTPFCETILDPQEPQTVLFQWQASNAPSPVSMSMPEYTLTLYEITNPDVNPLQAIQSRQALQIFESDPLMATTFFYDASAPPLELGKRYVWQVRVEDPDGKQMYKNDGKSQLCSFQYGYAVTYDGDIPTLSPQNEASIDRSQPLLMSWNVPSNVNENQKVTYNLKVVELEEGQDAETAITDNAAWYEETTPEINPRYEWETEIRQNIRAEKVFAWQVTAFIGDEQVAASEVQTFNSGAFLDRFRAGKHTVILTEVTNSDPNDFSGTGKFQISEEEDSVEVTFEGFKLKQAGRQWTLLEGELIAPYEGDVIELEAELSDNANGFFKAQNYVLDKRGLKLLGQMAWPLPHAVASGKPDSLRSKFLPVNYDEYSLKGSVFLSNQNTFNLVDPLGFTLAMDTTSDFLVNKGKFKLRLNGNVLLPEKVKGFEQSDERVKLPFLLADQLLNITVSDQIPITNNINLITGTGITLKPTVAQVDLSEGESPGALTSSPAWKGAYYDKFTVELINLSGGTLDGTNQLEVQEVTKLDFDLSSAFGVKGWTDAQGMQVKFSKSLATKPKIGFNTFAGDLEEVSINIEDNEILNEGSILEGAILIGFLSETKKYDFEVPLSAQGLEEGYLVQGLNNQNFIFNPGDYDQEMYITIQRAVFKENEYLDMEIDLTWPRLEATAEGVSGFRIWGDNTIGFTEKNGKRNFSTQVAGKLDKTPVSIQAVSAGYSFGSFGFYTEMAVVMGEDVVGENGPPITNLRSVAKAELSSENLPDASISDVGVGAAMQQVVAARAVTESDDELGKGDPVEPVAPKIDSPILNISKPVFRYVPNDPLWGASFQGSMEVELKIPTQILFKGIYINGRKDDFNYWFIEAGFTKGGRTEGMVNDAYVMTEEEEKEAEAEDEAEGNDGAEVGLTEDDYKDRAEGGGSVAGLSDFVQESEAAAASIESYEKEISDAVSEEEKDKQAKEDADRELTAANNKLALDAKDLKKAKNDLEEAKATAQNNISKATNAYKDALAKEESSNDPNDYAEAEKKRAKLERVQNGANKKQDELSKTVKKQEDVLSGTQRLKKEAEVKALKAKSKLAKTKRTIRKQREALTEARKIKEKADSRIAEIKRRKDERAAKRKKKKKHKINGDSEIANQVQDNKKTPKQKTNAKMGKGVTLVGIEGRIYKNMNRTDAGRVSEGTSGEFAYEPDKEAPFGFYFRVQLEDSKTGGSVFTGFGAFEYTKLKGGERVGIELGMELTAQSGNSGSAVIAGTYNSVKEEFTLQGRAEYTGAICAKGNFAFFSDPRGIEFSLGQKDDRITVGSCVGWAGTGWLHLSTIDRELEVGAGVSFIVKLNGPWLPAPFSKAKARGKFEAGATLAAYGAFQYSPFKMKKIGLYAELYAKVDLEYDIDLFILKASGSIELASLLLVGDATVFFDPSRFEASLSGRVRILELVTIKLPDLAFEKDL